MNITGTQYRFVQTFVDTIFSISQIDKCTSHAC